MKCPHCEYEPYTNENDYTEAPGMFFELGIEAKQELTGYAKHEYRTPREAVLGCPRCGVMFMNMGFD